MINRRGKKNPGKKTQSGVQGSSVVGRAEKARIPQAGIAMVGDGKFEEFL